MRRLSMLFIVVTMCGCETFSRKKTASGWVVLDKAESVKCSKWPLREKDLGINELIAVKGDRPGFLASGITRDAKPMQLWAPFTGDVAIDKESIQTLSLGRGATLAGGVDINGEPTVGVIYNFKSKATLELRSVKGNLVRYKGELSPSAVESATIKDDEPGAWVTYKLDEGGYGLAYLDLSAKKAVTGKVVSGATFWDTPAVIPQTNGKGALALWKGGDEKHPFKVRTIAETGTAGEPQALGVAVESQAESWAATTHGGTYYVAVIDGDSLIGQSNLRVAALGMGESGPSVKWTKDAPLKDVHVNEPTFVQTEEGLEILLLKWVDEESTIARYVVAGGTLGQPVFSGIFPKGARIVDAFVGEDRDDVFVIVRHRQDERWSFQICKL